MVAENVLVYSQRNACDDSHVTGSEAFDAGFIQ